MAAKKLSPREARLLTDLVLCAGVKVPLDTSDPDDRRIIASLVVHGYIECRAYDGGSQITAKATREGTYRILNPGKL